MMLFSAGGDMCLVIQTPSLQIRKNYIALQKGSCKMSQLKYNKWGYSIWCLCQCRQIKITLSSLEGGRCNVQTSRSNNAAQIGRNAGTEKTNKQTDRHNSWKHYKHGKNTLGTVPRKQVWQSLFLSITVLGWSPGIYFQMLLFSDAASLSCVA